MTLREKLAHLMYELVVCDTVYDDDIQRERAYVDDPYDAADAILAAVAEALTSDEAVSHAIVAYRRTERTSPTVAAITAACVAAGITKGGEG